MNIILSSPCLVVGSCSNRADDRGKRNSAVLASIAATGSALLCLAVRNHLRLRLAIPFVSYQRRVGPAFLDHLPPLSSCIRLHDQPPTHHGHHHCTASSVALPAILCATSTSTVQIPQFVFSAARRTDRVAAGPAVVRCRRRRTPEGRRGLRDASASFRGAWISRGCPVAHEGPPTQMA